MKKVTKRVILALSALVAVIFVSSFMTDTIQAAPIITAQPLMITPGYEELLQAQAVALAQQQQQVLQAQDIALTQQQQYALQAQSAALVQQQQQLMAQTQAAALSQLQVAQEQQILAAYQNYNNARYLQQMSLFQACYLNSLQGQQRVNFDKMMYNQQLDYRNLIANNFTKEDLEWLEKAYGIKK